MTSSTPSQAEAELESLRGRVASLEQQLTLAQARNETYFARALALLGIAGFDGYFKNLNPMWSRVLGWSDEELMAKPFLEFVHPDDREATLGAASQLGQEGREIISFENRYQCKDGTYRWLRWNSTPDMERGLIMAIAHDITQEKESQDRLRASEARFREIALNIPGGVFQFTVRDGIWVMEYVSERMGEIVGVPAAEIARDLQRLIDRIHPEDRAAYVSSVQQAVADMAPWHFEGRIVRPDGEVRWCQGDSKPARDPRGDVVFHGVLFDITERKIAEEAQRQTSLQEEIIRAQDAALAELSTPLIPITDSVVVMPLIGSVDSRRAQQVMETLLEGIGETRAQTAILDITGVPVVDTQVANALVRAAQAARLLGASVVLTGIRPEVAQTLVGLGVDLSGITTRSSLQSGIATAINGRG